MERLSLAVPSSMRWHRTRTLEQLEEVSLRMDISYYVPIEQSARYRMAMPAWVKVVPRGGRAHQARTAIMEDHRGADVMMMDDDIPWFVGCLKVFPDKASEKAPKTPKLNAMEVGNMGFRALDITGLKAWGVYPVPYSGTALQPRIGVGEVFLCGGAFGLRVPSEGMGFSVDLHVKEDYEITARLLERDKAVVRLDCVCPYTVVGEGDGGMAEHRTSAAEELSVAYLTSQWPQWFTRRADRAGLPQVKFHNKVDWYDVGEVMS